MTTLIRRQESLANYPVSKVYFTIVREKFHERGFLARFRLPDPRCLPATRPGYGSDYRLSLVGDYAVGHHLRRFARGFLHDGAARPVWYCFYHLPTAEKAATDEFLDDGRSPKTRQYFQKPHRGGLPTYAAKAIAGASSAPCGTQKRRSPGAPTLATAAAETTHPTARPKPAVTKFLTPSADKPFRIAAHRCVQARTS